MKCCISRDIALIKPINKTRVLLSLVYHHYYKNIQEYRPIDFLRIISRFHRELYVRLFSQEFKGSEKTFKSVIHVWDPKQSLSPGFPSHHFTYVLL